MAQLWKGRFKKELAKETNDFNSSIKFDSRMFEEDIKGSIAHATMLGATGIIDKSESDKIVDGLNGILDNIKSGKLAIDMNAEDIHTFVEGELTARLGQTGKRLHTARSRNDQVALDIRMVLKKEIDEISEKIKGMTPEKVREIQKISLEPVSLETPIGEEDDSHLGDFIEDEGAMSPNDYAANELLKDELNDVLLELTDREEKVLRLRFGLDDGRTRTLEEVGREFNVTRERIRQIEAKALRKLKHPSRSKRLKDFLDR